MRMDARLDTFSDELCQVNTCVGHIARCQVAMGGYTTASLSLPAFEDEDGDDGADVFDVDKDDDASSSSIDEMST